jgi:carbamoyl-phosphate synthase large subunit
MRPTSSRSTPQVIETIIDKERPDALLPTLGGQTALNAAIALYESGVLEKYGVELIGADVEAIQRGEDRQKFKDIAVDCGAEVARSAICHTLDEALAAAEELNYPGRRAPVLHHGRARFGHGV